MISPLTTKVVAPGAVSDVIAVGAAELVLNVPHDRPEPAMQWPEIRYPRIGKPPVEIGADQFNVT